MPQTTKRIKLKIIKKFNMATQGVQGVLNDRVNFDEYRDDQKVREINEKIKNDKFLTQLSKEIDATMDEMVQERLENILI